ncbi:hypothetical protein HY605_03950, partial [Candidatus Peregrinibacteria bacterium]|nr:hypothetical protein [Candidatus Peregrinibacteria bacterium]
MKLPQLSKDIGIFLKIFGKHGVRYLIVGGVAVIYHGYPRYTGDIDIFYDREEENAKKLFKALEEFWEGNIPAIKSYSELKELGIIIQFGQPPNRIDLINQIDGVTFAQAWDNLITEQIAQSPEEPVTTYIINKELLIANKQSCTRPKD